jgi:hypothetical protein
MGKGWTARSSPFTGKRDFHGRPLTVNAFYNIMIGYFFGFALGVGSALAVLYAIYSGGYRRAVEHSLMEQHPQRYVEARAAAIRRAEREKAKSN